MVNFRTEHPFCVLYVYLHDIVINPQVKVR